MKKYLLIIVLIFETSISSAQVFILPPALEAQIPKESRDDYIKRAEKAYEEKDKDVVACVEWLQKETQGRGYGAIPGSYYGEVSSWEYCQWRKEKGWKP